MNTLTLGSYSRSGIVLVLVATLALTLFFRQVGIQNLSDVAKRDGETRARAALSVLRDAIVPSLQAANESAGAGTRAPPLPEASTRAIERVARELDLRRVEIHDGRGFTRYVTPTDGVEDGERGEDVSTNPGFLGAMTGKSMGALAYRNEMSRFDGTNVQSNVVEYYLPIRGVEGGPVIGVFEAYIDADPLVGQMQRMWLWAGVASLAMFTLFYLSMSRALRKAENSIAALLPSAVDMGQRQFLASIHEQTLEALANIRRCLESLQSRATPEGMQNTFSTAVALGPLVQQSIRMVRGLAIGVAPPQLREKGLLASLQTLGTLARGRSGGLATRFQFDVRDDEVIPKLRVVIYRIVEAVLGEMCGQASSQTCRVRLSIDAQALTLDIVVIPSDGEAGAPRPQFACSVPPEFQAQLEEWVLLSDGQMEVRRQATPGPELAFRWPGAGTDAPAMTKP